jgi:ATP-dependent helicase/nuclease subunit B
VPRFFELKIDGKDERLPRPATFEDEEGRRVYIYGSIDRVDTYKSGEDVYVRVIDYKTGAKEFSPDDIDEGKNLQMFLYLKAITETDNSGFREELGVGKSGEIIPAGVIYIKTDLSDVTVGHADFDAEADAIRAKQKRRGMILYDEKSISAQNKDYLPVKFSKKTGAPDARYEKFLYTGEGWIDLSNKIGEKITEISSRMRSGDISEAKEERACESCKFKAVCRRGK